MDIIIMPRLLMSCSVSLAPWVTAFETVSSALLQVFFILMPTDYVDFLLEDVALATTCRGTRWDESADANFKRIIMLDVTHKDDYAHDW